MPNVNGSWVTLFHVTVVDGAAFDLFVRECVIPVAASLTYECREQISGRQF